jgi:CheY-like chemotaxis protein
VAPLIERSLTVLAVDDDALVRMNTALMLEDLGHVAMEAQSGKEALRMLDEGGLPDIVITDQAMPEMTGVELIEPLAKR